MRIPIPDHVEVAMVDAGGVINVPNMTRLAKEFGIQRDVNEMLDAFAESNDRPGTPEKEADRYAWQWEGFLRVLNLDPTDVRFETLLALPPSPQEGPWFPTASAPGVEEALRKLVEGVPAVVVVSNNNYGTVATELAEARICQVGEGPGVPVATVIDSFLVGSEKPDPAIFEAALKVANASADEAVMIGDSAYADMEGARRSGIAGIHISRLDSCTDDSHFHAVDLPAAVEFLLSSSRT